MSKSFWPICIFLFSLLSFGLVGCSDGGSKGKNLPPGEVGELGYDPKSRWPENGNFSYDLRYSVNGSSCRAQKSFLNKADYCMGLQDDQLNDDCAQPLRRNTYTQNCGSDFQPMNFIASYWQSGFDERLQQNCQTGKAPDARFRLVSHFCQFLKDEMVHRNCFWDRRKIEFGSRKCVGEFSPEPGRVTPQPIAPNPTPTPNPPRPTPTPQPTDPLDQIEVVRNLRAEGIQVSVNWRVIRDDSRFDTDGISLEKKMQNFWNELSRIQSAIIVRKAFIQEIQITSYTSYHSRHRAIMLQYELRPGEGNLYINLFDRLLNFNDRLGFSFSGIHGHGSLERVPFSSLQLYLELVQAFYPQLLSLKGLIQEFQFENYSAYFSSSRQLSITRESAKEELGKWIELLKPLAPVYNWVDKSGVKFRADFDLSKDAATVHRAFQAFAKNLQVLQNLWEAKMLSEIQYQVYESRPSYYSSSKVLALNYSAPHFSKAIRGLGDLAQKSLEFKKPIRSASYELDDNFLKSIELMNSVWGRLRPKLAKVEEIEIGYSSNYYTSLKKLIIGYSSSLAQTQKVIDSIP